MPADHANSHHRPTSSRRIVFAVVWGWALLIGGIAVSMRSLAYSPLGRAMREPGLDGSTDSWWNFALLLLGHYVGRCFLLLMVIPIGYGLWRIYRLRQGMILVLLAVLAIAAIVVWDVARSS